MTNLTPAQEEALNRTIAEFDGKDYDLNKQWPQQGGTNLCCYTRSLDAIVPVVQRWCDTQTNIPFGKIKILSQLKDTWFLSDNPALALCIAFAQAAGIEWEGK